MPHCSEYIRGVTGAATQVGSRMLQDGIAVAEGIQQCTGVGRSVQWHVQEYWDDRWYEEAYGVAQRDLGVLPPGTPIDEDTGHTFGCSSPRIDGDTDQRYLMVSMGTHTPDPLLRHLQERVIWLLSLDTLGTSSRGWGAHPRYLD